jgi:DNA-3-methyladenine glycosylase I
VNLKNEAYVLYHDEEWGVPVSDDTKLFEFMILEGAQAGLSWETILNRRNEYRKAFKRFDPKKVSKMTTKDIKVLLKNGGIIRNRLKVTSAITNAKMFIEIQKEFGSFNSYLHTWTNGTQIQNKRRSSESIPAQTDLSASIAKDLKNRGFSFIGPTIMYAYMQAVGIVNDHTTDCFRYDEINTV